MCHRAAGRPGLETAAEALAAPLKSEKGNVAVPLRRVDQVRLWNRNFLVPFLPGTFSLSLLAGFWLPGGNRFRRDLGCGCGQIYHSVAALALGRIKRIVSHPDQRFFRRLHAL